ncbi:hypothetical protein [Almyronema epifaneia]|uniref:Uncharacterized protein n=1 Tax=Almyronema epifaneia S1 TaxID=2991925 RepID=A0ABW6I9X4_9CYAN
MFAEKHRKVLAEYYQLASLPQLSEKQAERLAEILEIAQYNEVLSLLINEIDERTFQKLAFNELAEVDHHKNEISKIKEFVSEEPCLMNFAPLIGRYPLLENFSIDRRAEPLTTFWPRERAKFEDTQFSHLKAEFYESANLNILYTLSLSDYTRTRTASSIVTFIDVFLALLTATIWLIFV